ncbi:MAG: phosphopentomutase [Bacteroidia bacterium]|nr:phosphopentomutase [Bacteroidia bacterium]
MAKRVLLIVLDSVGIGELPDAAAFGDVGSHTLGHIARDVPGFNLPNLGQLGLGNITPSANLPASSSPAGAFGKAAEQSQGKDTITGHWEIAGLVPDLVFPYYPHGFPPSIMDEFHKRIGTQTLANYPESGTVVIDKFGEEHMKTGFPIVYTSTDSVFQIAMHEDIIPLDRQYEICQIARDLLVGENAVGRVIARPFVGQPGSFKRTSNRHDYAIDPPGHTVLDSITEAGMLVKGVGKIKDIFNGHGISENAKSVDNQDGINHTLDFMAESFSGLIFTNLVDFDMLYGHRRDPEGYGRCLEEFDARLPEILAALREDDVLMLTADHGNDPTFKGTDHTREYIPLLVTGKEVKKGVSIGTRACFSDIAATIAEILAVSPPPFGKSFWQEIVS